MVYVNVLITLSINSKQVILKFTPKDNKVHKHSYYLSPDIKIDMNK